MCRSQQEGRAEKEKYRSLPDFAKYEALKDEGVDLSRLTYSEIRHLRKDLQIIFQDPYSSLNPRLTVGQIIEEGLVTLICTLMVLMRLSSISWSSCSKCRTAGLYAAQISPPVLRWSETAYLYRQVPGCTALSS